LGEGNLNLTLPTIVNSFLQRADAAARHTRGREPACAVRR
jgi:hypothetical protein